MKRIFCWSIATLLLLTLQHASADERDEAGQFCREYTAETGVGCSSQRCPCGRTTTRIKRWDRGGLRIAWCACASKADLVRAGETPPAECGNDADCQDGVFCNGRESCSAGRCVAADAESCPSGGCNERLGRCEAVMTCEDRDGDGACGVDDCDDNDPRRFRGNQEICDAQGIDEDCDPRTVGDRDEDGDGFIAFDCV